MHSSGGSPDGSLYCDVTADSYDGGSADLYDGVFAGGCTKALGGMWEGHLQEDSTGQMVTRTVMVGLLADKVVEADKVVAAEVHIVMGLVEHLRELVDVVRQNMAVTSKWSSGYAGLCWCKSWSKTASNEASL